MAETVKPPKRRRILDPSAIVSVPIYSNQVSNSLQMKAPVFSETRLTDEETDADEGFWSKFSYDKKKKPPLTVTLSDSEEEETEPDRTEPQNPSNPLAHRLHLLQRVRSLNPHGKPRRNSMSWSAACRP
ncbi:hypothetical protein WMY93_001610 [Mugilogobius chulae]|uniref:Uncharacterized protein n=1 Tax=Mugilogobius chulae TaxID=88201 RepID=A0AAW0PUQ5_9GOBI